MPTNQVDGNSLLSMAEMNGKIYPTKKSWRNMQIFAGVLTCLLIITIPFGIWIIIRARNARAGITDQGFAFKYLSTVAFSWDDVESIRVSQMSGMTFGGGLVGVAAAAAVKKKTVGVKGPVHVKLKDRKRPFMIPAHTIQNSMEMLEEMQRLSGVTVNQED